MQLLAASFHLGAIIGLNSGGPGSQQL